METAVGGLISIGDIVRVIISDREFTIRELEATSRAGIVPWIVQFFYTGLDWRSESRVVPIRICQRRRASGSNLATCSGVRFQQWPRCSDGSCSSFLAPMITVATEGRCNSQLSAICGTVLPVSLATRPAHRQP